MKRMAGLAAILMAAAGLAYAGALDDLPIGNKAEIRELKAKVGALNARMKKDSHKKTSRINKSSSRNCGPVRASGLQECVQYSYDDNTGECTRWAKVPCPPEKIALVKPVDHKSSIRNCGPVRASGLQECVQYFYDDNTGECTRWAKVPCPH